MSLKQNLGSIENQILGGESKISKKQLHRALGSISYGLLADDDDDRFNTTEKVGWILENILGSIPFLIYGVNSDNLSLFFLNSGRFWPQVYIVVASQNLPPPLRI